MAENELKVILGADGRPLNKTLGELTADLKRFGADLQKSFDPKVTAQLNRSILETQKNIATIKSVGVGAFSGLKPGANEAAFAMQNVGRVAQDLPFGFIGIQNNLNPLLESFARLKAETGSGSLALKAMASSLGGVGGLGLALSVVSAAILIYQNGIAGFNKKTKEATDKSKEFADTLKNVDDIIGDAGASVAGQIATVNALAGAVLNTNKSYKERKNALEQLHATNKSHFGDLTLEASSLSTLTDKVNKYTQALIAQSVVKAFGDEIGRVSKELFTQNKALDEAKLKMDQARVALEKFGALTTTSATGEERLKAGAGKIENAFKGAEKTFLTQRDVVEKLDTNYAELSGAIEKAVSASLKFKSASSSETDALKDQIKALEDLESKTGLLKVEKTKLLELKIQLVLRDGGKDGFNKGQVERIVNNLQTQIDQGQISTIKFKVAVVPDVKPTSPADVFSGAIASDFNKSGLDAMISSANAARERFANLNIDIAQTTNMVGRFLTPAFSTLFDELLSGGRSAFSAIGNFLKTLIKQLISTIATAAALALIINAIGGGGGGFMPLFKSFLGFTGPKLAQGGITNGPTIAMIGESGREAVIPLNRIDDMMGGANSQVQFGELRLSGGDLYQSWRIWNAKHNRLY